MPFLHFTINCGKRETRSLKYSRSGIKKCIGSQKMFSCSLLCSLFTLTGERVREIKSLFILSALVEKCSRSQKCVEQSSALIKL